MSFEIKFIAIEKNVIRNKYCDKPSGIVKLFGLFNY